MLDKPRMCVNRLPVPVPVVVQQLLIYVDKEGVRTWVQRGVGLLVCKPGMCVNGLPVPVPLVVQQLLIYVDKEGVRMRVQRGVGLLVCKPRMCVNRLPVPVPLVVQQLLIYIDSLKGDQYEPWYTVQLNDLGRTVGVESAVVDQATQSGCLSRRVDANVKYKDEKILYNL